jgi:predicted ATPase
MKKDGNLDSWPDGFFDQLDKDLAFLIGWEE